MEPAPAGKIISTLADLSSTDVLWPIFGLVTIFTVIMSLIFYYHWHRFIVGHQTVLLVAIIYTIGVVFLLASIALSIIFFAGL